MADESNPNPNAAKMADESNPTPNAGAKAGGQAGGNVNVQNGAPQAQEARVTVKLAPFWPDAQFVIGHVIT